MSKGYRDGAFALGVVVGAGIVLNLILWLGYQDQRKADQSASADSHEKGEQVNTDIDWFIGTFINPSDTLAQWIMAIFTIAIVVLVWRTLIATQDIARDTRDIGQKQARAYMFLRIGNVEFSITENKDGSNLVVKIAVELTNSGSTPSYSPIIYYDIQEAVQSDIIPQAQPDTMQSSPINTSFIPANGKSKSQLSRVWEVDDPIAFQRFKERLVRFSYCVNFLDEFGEDRWTPIISGTFQNWPEGSISFLPDKLHKTASG
jgi:hypothetical protein